MYHQPARQSISQARPQGVISLSCYSLAMLSLFILYLLWPNSSAAATSLAGVWQITGNDQQLGPYSGLLELRQRADGGNLDVIRVVHLERYQHQDGRGVDLVWTGTISNSALSGTQIQVALTRGDFITQVGNLKRTPADSQPLQVIGNLQVQGNNLAIQYHAPAEPSFAVTETALPYQASGAQPIWQAQRFERDTHGDLLPFKLDSSLKFLITLSTSKSVLDMDALEKEPRDYLFKRFADFHQLPAVQAYVNNPLFKRAIHQQIVDRTDFDFYQQNPKILRVINKVVDAISLAETEVRANAFRASFTDKEKFYQSGLTNEFVGKHGMVFRGIDTAGQEIPDQDGALWTGVYIYTQALRYQMTGEEEALNNVRRSLQGILTLLNITGNSSTFARTLRPHANTVTAPWRAGSGEFAAFDWLEGGNNDMAKGVVLGMIASWEVLPNNDPLRSSISGNARRLIKMDKFQIDEGDNGAMALLLYGITNSGFLADVYKGSGQTILRNPLLKEYAKSGGGSFYLFGISDWSGNHLTLTTALCLQRLLSHTNADDLQAWWAEAPALAWERHLQKLEHPLHAALALASGKLTDLNKRKEALEQIQWAQRSFPLPKHNFNVDHRLRADFVMSPFPTIPWKLDWMTNNDRQQSIRAYPLFEQVVDEYRWNDSHFMLQGYGLTDRRVPGTDYLFLYWLARNSQIECLLNWAETAVPKLLAPANADTYFQAPNMFRYYRDTKATVYISSTNNHVYYQGPNGIKEDVGSLSSWLDVSACQ